MYGHQYTAEEHAFMTQYVPGHSYREIQQAFIDKFGWEITSGQIGSYIGNHHLNTGRTGRFPKGHEPVNKGMKCYKDKTLLCFMYASGTRAQEICDLTVGDIQFYTDRAGINIHGKGQKVRRIGIPCDASNMLKKYIEHRRIINDTERHVFSSQTHEKMSVSCIEEIYSKYIDKAKREYPEMFRYSYTPHSMRHTTATHMLEAGVPLIVVKNFLGHVSLQTTQIYTEITQDTMNKQLKSWNDKWFLKDNSHFEDTNGKSNIPKFLR